MSELPLVRARVAKSQHVCSGLLIAAFAVLGWFRLNDCDLFNPDSPRYLIYAQGLLITGEYRSIDGPGELHYTWRPPGLPALLTPVLAISPYNIVAAKGVVLFTGCLLLVMLHLLATTRLGRWGGPVAVAAVGCSPHLLALSTEVLSEVPYTLAVLAIVFWLGRTAQEPDKPNVLRFAALLTAMLLLPALRTIGLALLAAVFLWSLTSRWRRPYLVAAILAGLSVVWRAWSASGAGGDNYAGSLTKTLRDKGLSTVLIEAWTNLAFYTTSVPGLLIPGVTSERPYYAAMVIDALPQLGTMSRFVMGTIVGLVLLGVLGVWIERRRAGGLVLLYVPLYVACLAVWPWRHERFLWPLVPLLWAFVPTGFAFLMNGFRPSSRRILMPVALLWLVGLCLFQLKSDAALIASTRAMNWNRDAFHSAEMPGFYFSDWRKAGQWIREATPSHERLLTWHAAVGGTAHRYQRRASLEALSPGQLRSQMESFGAKKLVTLAGQFGDGFAWQILRADPSTEWRIVYLDRDVAVIDRQPNRTGFIDRDSYDDWLAEQWKQSEEFAKRHPDRRELVFRRASLLNEMDRNDDAIRLMRDAIQSGFVTARSCSDMGWYLLEAKRYEEALKYFERARVLPYSEVIAASLADGAQRCRERLSADGEPDGPTLLKRTLARTESLVAALKWAPAEREAERAMELDSENADANYWRGYIHHVFGEESAANERYRKAEQLGSEQAQAKRRLLRWTEELSKTGVAPSAFQQHRTARIPFDITSPLGAALSAEETSESIDETRVESFITWAKMLAEHGWTGRSLAVLEGTRDKFDDSPELLFPLGELYLKFARPQEALSVFETILKLKPDSQHPDHIQAQQGIEAATSLLRTPKY